MGVKRDADQVPPDEIRVALGVCLARFSPASCHSSSFARCSACVHHVRSQATHIHMLRSGMGLWVWGCASRLVAVSTLPLTLTVT